MRLRLLASLCFAFAATLAHAQAPVLTGPDTTVLPVWNNDSGRVEALLLLEPAENPLSPLDRLIGKAETAPAIGTGVRLRLDGGSSIEAALKLEPSSNLALLCSGSSGLSSTLGGLAQHCLLASLNDPDNKDGLAAFAPRLSAETSLVRPEGRLALSFGIGEYDLASGTAPLLLPGLPAETDWLAASPLPASLLGSQVEQQDVGLLGQLNLGSNGWIAIGGTLARARLIPAGTATGTAADSFLAPTQRWNTATLGLGGGYGAFSGSLIGRVVDIPGEDESTWGGLGIGVTWRTPWRGQLTVGAENLITHGQNPWRLPEPASSEDEGSIPYVRYQQDL